MSYPTTFPAEGPVDVFIKQTSGEIVVKAADTTEVTVGLRAAGPGADELIAETTVDFRSGALRIEVPRSPGRMSRSSVDINVTVPSGSSADLRTGSGDITVDGEFAAVAGAGGSGDIAIQRGVDVTVSTGSGEIRVGRVDNQAEFTSGSGDIEVAESLASGRASSGSGDVKIADLGGPFEAKTASGDITIGRVTEGELLVKAVSGDVTVGIASGTAAHLDVSTVSGRMRSELDETDAPAATDRTLMLSARTVSGSINLERRT